MPDEATLEQTPEIAEDALTGSEESHVDADTSVSVTESELSASQAKTLADILRRDKEAEKSGEPLDLTDEELDLYDKYTEGKIKPEEEKKDKKAKPEEEAEDESPKEESKEKAELPKEIQDIMKLTGAKDEKDLAKKVKDLTNNVANKSKDVEYVSKLSQEYKEMQNRIKNETTLWEDFKNGNPTAVKYAEEHYGVIPKTANKKNSQAQSSDDDDGEYEIDVDAFLDENAGKKLNTMLKGFNSKVSQLEKQLEEANQKLTKTEQYNQKIQQEADSSRANKDLLTETVGMAKQFDALKDIPNLEDQVHKFLAGENTGDLWDSTIGKIFQEVKDAKTRGERITLKTAFKMLKADDADLLIQQAESNGRKSAYQEHQPSRSLSEKQTGGEASQYRNYTDDEIQGFLDDPESIPNSFFDPETFEPLPKEKLPPKARKLFY